MWTLSPMLIRLHKPNKDFISSVLELFKKFLLKFSCRYNVGSMIGSDPILWKMLLLLNLPRNRRFQKLSLWKRHMKVAKHLKVLYIAGVLLITMGYDLHCYASGCMLPGSTILGEAPNMGLAGGYLPDIYSPSKVLGCSLVVSEAETRGVVQYMYFHKSVVFWCSLCVSSSKFLT